MLIAVIMDYRCFIVAYDDPVSFADYFQYCIDSLKSEWPLLFDQHCICFNIKLVHHELSVALCHLHRSLNSMRKTGRSPCLSFYVKHICHMQSLEIKISLLARVSGWFTDQRSVFHLRINGFISAFPAISSNVYIITLWPPRFHFPFIFPCFSPLSCTFSSAPQFHKVVIKI